MGQNQSHGFRQGIEDSGFSRSGWKLCGPDCRHIAVDVAHDGTFRWKTTPRPTNRRARTPVTGTFTPVRRNPAISQATQQNCVVQIMQ